MHSTVRSRQSLKHFVNRAFASAHRWNRLTPMHDARFDKLAKLLVEYSTTLKRNETVLIESFDAAR